QGGGVGSEVGDDLGDLAWGGDVNEPGARCDVLADGAGDPAGVGDGRVDHVGRDPERSKLEGRRHRVVFLRGLCGPIGDFLGEAEVAAGGQADDPAPGCLPGDVAPGELADHQGRTHRVDGELPGPGCGGTGWIDRPSRSVVTVAKVSASHPVALLTRMSTGPNCSSAASNSFLAWPLGQVGFYGGCLPPPSRMRPTTAAATWARWSRYSCGVSGSSGSSTRKNVHRTAH